MKYTNIDTKIVKIRIGFDNRQALEEAAVLIRAGKLVVFPTETVYGLGGNGLDTTAIRRIYAAKGRPSDNPVILHVPDQEAVKPLVESVSPVAQKLMDTFWPGPLTIIFPRSPIVPDAATGGLNTIAIRCPSDPIAHEFLELTKVPVAGPSANISGRPSPTTVAGVIHDLMGRVEVILAGGDCEIGVESTVVECTAGGGVTILRPGGITKEMLETVVGPVAVDENTITGKGVPKAPGMKYRHYAPAAPLTIVSGEPAAVRSKILALYEEKKQKGQRVGFLVSDELAAELPYNSVFSWGKRADKAAMANNLYKGLLFFDDESVDFILAEGVPTVGLGEAIMNRLLKAAGHHILYV